MVDRRIRRKARRDTGRTSISDLKVDLSDRFEREVALISGIEQNIQETDMPDFAQLLLDNEAQLSFSMNLVKEKGGWAFQTPEKGGGIAEGAAATFSTTSTTYVDAVIYTVPVDTTARLDEMATTGGSNAKVKFLVQGRTVATDVNAEDGPGFSWGGANLEQENVVKIQVKSEDGSAAEISGMISVREL